MEGRVGMIPNLRESRFISTVLVNKDSTEEKKGKL